MVNIVEAKVKKVILAQHSTAVRFVIMYIHTYIHHFIHTCTSRLLASRKWLQNMSITSKVIDTSAIVELSSLKQQLEQTQRNYKKQLSKLTLELKQVSSDRDRICLENKVMSQKLHSKENSIQGLMDVMYRTLSTKAN